MKHAPGRGSAACRRGCGDAGDRGPHTWRATPEARSRGRCRTARGGCGCSRLQPPDGALEKGGAGGATQVGPRLDVRHAAVIIARHVHVLPAGGHGPTHARASTDTTGSPDLTSLDTLSSTRSPCTAWLLAETLRKGQLDSRAAWKRLRPGGAGRDDEQQRPACAHCRCIGKTSDEREILPRQD